MSRSRRHNPCIKIAGSSDKKDKRMANRKFRRITREKVNFDSDPPVRVREVANTWSFSSDGLANYLKFANSRKQEDIEQVKIFMRK